MLQGDTEQLLAQGIASDTVLEVTGAQIAALFSGTSILAYGSVYDVYIRFMQSDEISYHRIVVVFSDDG